MVEGYSHARDDREHWRQGWSPEHLIRRRLQLLHLRVCVSAVKRSGIKEANGGRLQLYIRYGNTLPLFGGDPEPTRVDGPRERCRTRHRIH